MQQKHVLENGLTVLLNPKSNFKSVSVEVYVKSGSADEPTDKHGIAHFVEHMLFKGCKTVLKNLQKSMKTYYNFLLR